MTITRLSVLTIDEGNLGKAVISCLRTEPPFFVFPSFSRSPISLLPSPVTRLSHAPIVNFPSSRDFHRAGRQLGANSQATQTCK